MCHCLSAPQDTLTCFTLSLAHLSCFTLSLASHYTLSLASNFTLSLASHFTLSLAHLPHSELGSVEPHKTTWTTNGMEHMTLMVKSPHYITSTGI